MHAHADKYIWAPKFIHESSLHEDIDVCSLIDLMDFFAYCVFLPKSASLECKVPGVGDWIYDKGRGVNSHE